MIDLTKSRRLVLPIACFHILIIAASNYLVQFPVTVLGYKTTWGAFTFPFIFLATDLTVRLFGARPGRRIVFYAMLPALLVSYFFTTAFRNGEWIGFGQLFIFNLFVFRIAIASFSAYVVGQILDIFVFNKLREHRQWWHPPIASGVFGSFADTLTFFFIAFYKTSDTFLAENWMEIAAVDYVFKIMIQGLLYLPLYKIMLDGIVNRVGKREWRSNDDQQSTLADE